MYFVSKPQAIIWSCALILAPIIVAVAHLLIFGRGINATSGWLGVVGYTTWIIGFMGLFQLLSHKMPRFSIIGFCAAAYGCVACTNFMTEIILMDALGIYTPPERAVIRDTDQVAAIFAYYFPVVLFPVSMILLGIQLSRLNILSLRVSMLLIMSAITFAIGRIPRIVWLIHFTNFLIILTNIAIVFSVFPRWKKEYTKRKALSEQGLVTENEDEEIHSPLS